GALLLALVPVVLALELLDAARGVDVLHLAGEERVTRGADFDGDVLARAARNELVAATAGDGRFLVFRVNAGFHEFTLLPCTGENSIVDKPRRAEKGDCPAADPRAPRLLVCPPKAAMIGIANQTGTCHACVAYGIDDRSRSGPGLRVL